MAGPLASLRGLSLRPAGSTRVSASKPLPPKQEGKADRQDAASLARAELAADRAAGGFLGAGRGGAALRGGGSLAGAARPGGRAVGESLGAPLEVEGRRVEFDLLGERLADRIQP